MSITKEVEKKIRRTELKLIILKILKSGFNQEPILQVVDGFADELEGFMKGGERNG